MEWVRRAMCRLCGSSCWLMIYSLFSDGFDRRYPQNCKVSSNFKSDDSFLSILHLSYLVYLFEVQHLILVYLRFQEQCGDNGVGGSLIQFLHLPLLDVKWSILFVIILTK